MPKIDIRKNVWDRQVAKLGTASQKAWLIADKTGFTECQVRIRLKKFGISLNDFREGRGPFAKYVLTMLDDQEFEERLINDIERYIKKSLASEPPAKKQKKYLRFNRAYSKIGGKGRQHKHKKLLAA